MIRVFDSTDKTYETNGNVVLQPTYSNIHKEDNGEYYLDIETNLQNEVIKHIESEEGTNVDLTYSTKLTDVDATKQHEFTKMYGETQQDSTTGKNLFDINGILYNGSIDKVNNGFKLTNNGTYRTLSIMLPNSLTSGTYKIVYTIKNSTLSNINTLRLNIRGDSGVSGTIAYGSSDGVSSITISETCDRLYAYILSSETSGATITLDNFMIIPSNITDTSYEPYTGGSPAPSPSYPFDIHNVSGDNTIEICGKNRFNIQTIVKGRLDNGVVGYANGTTALTLNDNSFSFTTNANYRGVVSDYISISEDFTISYTNLNTEFSISVACYDKTKTFISNGTITGLATKKYRNIEVASGTKFVRVCFYLSSTGSITITNPILEKGNTPQDYEAYTGQSQLISLGVENLFDKDSPNIIPNKYLDTNGVLQNATKSSVSDYIKVLPNTIYSMQPFNNVSQRLCFYDSSKTFISSVSLASINPNFTTPNNCEYIRTSFITSDSNIWQIEKGSKKNSYTPYGASYIELNKISTYQDYIYKDNDGWYLHKEIGKVVLDGSENGWGVSGTIGTNYRHNITKTNLNITSLADYNIFSNYFTKLTGNVGTWGTANLGGSYLIFHDKDGIYDNSQFKTWLSTHNTIVYYVLATPTDTEITDTTLLEQLENLNKMTLYEGINNISILPNDLVPTLKLHYNYVEGGDLTTGDYLKPNNIIVSNTPTGNQAFRITNIDKRTHKIKIKANHVFFDSLNYVIQDSYVVDKNCNDALDHLNNATDNISPFTTTSNINTINSYRCVRKSLYEAINVVLERWGGHLVRDNYDIKVMDTIGQDNGVVVRYAKNLKDIEVDYNWDEVCTKILPVGEDGLMLDEIYLYGDIQYDIPYSKVIHFAQDVDTTPYEDEDGNLDEDAYIQALKNDLRSQANNYLQEHQLPQVNYTLQANLEKITDVGDIIQVIDERLGVNITTSLISFDYDPILERYTYLEFGNFKKQLSNLTEIMATQTNEIVSEATATTRITLENELNEATSKIWGVLGSSYVLVEGDKILILDSLPKETATNVIMLNSAGMGFSNTGINGTFTSAWTIDNVLNMQNINVINLTADLIKGGTLKLGSNLNQNGILEVYDESNNLIAELNKDGLKMFATDGGYILINTTVGFAGYDRNNVKIYWADGDEFHMKKSVVEEEITLVDKMRIIPITITDEYDQIINDGIGFVSTL